MQIKKSKGFRSNNYLSVVTDLYYLTLLLVAVHAYNYM